MADLNGFDADQYEPLGDFDPLPKGNYVAIASDSTMKHTKAGTGSYLEITWEVVEGPHTDRKLWSRLNLDNPNTNAVEIANRELTSICRATGVMRPKDSSELHSIPVVLKVDTVTRRDNGEVTNCVRGYAAVSANTASATNNPSPATPPWKR